MEAGGGQGWRAGGIGGWVILGIGDRAGFVGSVEILVYVVFYAPGRRLTQAVTYSPGFPTRVLPL